MPQSGIQEMNMSFINKSLLALAVAAPVAVLALPASAQDSTARQDSAARDAAIGRCIRQAHLQFPNDVETDARAAVYKACMVAAGFQP